MSSKLPQLFQGMSSDDWSRVRRAASELGNDDVESVAVSIGYIDVGKSPGGQPFVGGASFDANGGGGLSYRKVPVMLWPKVSGLGAGARPTGMNPAGRIAMSLGGVRVWVSDRDGAIYLEPQSQNMISRLHRRQGTMTAQNAAQKLRAAVLRDAQSHYGNRQIELVDSFGDLI